MSDQYLYLSTLIPDEEFKKMVLVDKSPQMATHIFNWKIYNGIKSSHLTGVDFHIISTRPISDYPHNSTKIVYSKKWNTSDGEFHELFFINFPVIKTITQFISCLVASFKWCIYTKNCLKKGVFIDTYQLPYLICGYFISRLFNIPVIGVLTDPPNMDYKIMWESPIKARFRKINGLFSNYLIKKFTGVIALTQFLADEFCPGKKSLIMEAIAEVRKDPLKIERTEKFVILYSGSLLSVYGIVTFAKAFTQVPFTDAELWIYGKGDAEAKIIDLAKVDSRIKYFGFVDNKEIKVSHSKANLLVNPRPTNLPDSKYSFPSKILEYMLSGTPTLVTRLPGIPKEYDEYVLFFDGHDEDSMTKKICELYHTDRSFLDSFGERAKIFAETKGVQEQGQKIAEFIIKMTK